MCELSKNEIVRAYQTDDVPDELISPIDPETIDDPEEKEVLI